MNQPLIRNSEAYAAKHGLHLAERLGFGIHGIVHAVGSNPQLPPTSAVKAHSNRDAFQRERDIYRRLLADGVREVLGFNVPRLVRTDDDLMIVEMTIVTRPFVLDFAGAYMDAVPEFSDEIWDSWLEEKREQFGELWPKAQNVLAALEALGIHMVDVSPSNIAFR
jgi:hypothetical protein